MGYPDRRIVRLSEAQNHRCCYCGCIMTFDQNQETSVTRDHVMPKVFGGNNSWENLVAACFKCNVLRGNVDAYRFYKLMQDGNMRRLLQERYWKNRALESRFAKKALETAKESREAAWKYVERLKRNGT